MSFRRRPDSGPVDRLEFESASPRSVAELVFRRPRADTSCEVRGRLFVAGSPARLECELNWAVHDGSMSELEIDLSPAWLPDQVVIRGKDDPVAWHPSLLPSGNTRLHVGASGGHEHAQGAGGDGAGELDRFGRAGPAATSPRSSGAEPRCSMKRGWRGLTRAR